MRIKGDERILGDSDFVEAVLKEANEQLDRRYRLKAEGFDLEQVAQRVAAVMSIPDGVYLNRRPPCGHRCKTAQIALLLGLPELVMSMTDLAKRLNLTQPAVSIAVQTGEKIARESQYQLIDDCFKIKGRP